MGLLGDLTGLGEAAGAVKGIAEAVGGVIEKVVPDPDLKAKLAHETELALINQAGELQKAIDAAAAKQADINLEEAKSPSLFVSGWRPAAGWLCIVGIGYAALLQPIVSWISALFHGPAMPLVDGAALVSLLLALLGLGTMRSYEKTQGVARDTIAAPAPAPVKMFR